MIFSQKALALSYTGVKDTKNFKHYAIEATLIIFGASGSAYGQISAENIQQRCENEWPGDFSMINYCLEKQRDALIEWSDMHEAAVNSQNEVGAKVILKCDEEWPDDDVSMKVYCVKQQIEAVKKMQFYMNVAKNDATFASAAAKCFNDWPGDYRMQHYCMEKQYKAYQALK